MELFCFHTFVLNGCHILEMWQIHVSEASVFQFNTRKVLAVDKGAIEGWQNHMLLLPVLLIKQLVGTRNCPYCTVELMDQTLFLAQCANQPWPFFSPVSKGTTVPKLVSLATVETVELQFIIDQSLGLEIFLYPPHFHVACGVWKVVVPPSFLSSLRQTSEPQLCSDHWKDFFLTIHSELLWLFLKDHYPQEQ